MVEVCFLRDKDTPLQRQMAKKGCRKMALGVVKVNLYQRVTDIKGRSGMLSCVLWRVFTHRFNQVLAWYACGGAVVHTSDGLSLAEEALQCETADQTGNRPCRLLLTNFFSICFRLSAYTCYRTQWRVVHRGIKTEGWESRLCRLNSEYHNALAPLFIPSEGSELITSAW